MDEDIHQYAGEEIEVSYDVLRCTHARECVEDDCDSYDSRRKRATVATPTRSGFIRIS